MSQPELALLRKELQRAKRIAAERAAELHDLVEERLPMAFEELPNIANACYQACQHWSQLQQQLQALEVAAATAG